MCKVEQAITYLKVLSWHLTEITEVNRLPVCHPRFNPTPSYYFRNTTSEHIFVSGIEDGNVDTLFRKRRACYLDIV
jgi:hypothetical protein